MTTSAGSLTSVLPGSVGGSSSTDYEVMAGVAACSCSRQPSLLRAWARAEERTEPMRVPILVESPIFERGEAVTTRVEKTIEVDVPVRAVYNQWTQFEEFPEFMGGVEQVQQLSPT